MAIPTFEFASCVANAKIRGYNGGILIDFTAFNNGSFTFTWSGTGSTIYSNIYTVSFTHPNNHTTSIVVPAGTYHVDILEVSTGAILSADFTVLEPGTSTITVESPTGAFCSGTGSFKGKITGGGFGTCQYIIGRAPSYSQVATGTATEGVDFTVAPLVPGSYRVQYFFSTSCTLPDGSTVSVNNIIEKFFAVTSGKIIITSILDATNFICETTNPVITLTPTNGTAPYTFLWSGPSGFTSTLQNPVISTTGTPGQYTVQITDANGCTGTNKVTISCTTPDSCWKLTSCKSDPTGSQVFYVSNDLTSIDGKVINGVIIPGQFIDLNSCWRVSQQLLCVSPLAMTSYNAFFSDCTHCIATPCPVESPYQRVIPDPVKVFFEVKESACDIEATKQFAIGYFDTVKQGKYGISSCNTSDLESLWLDKQISDLQAILLPGYTCTHPVTSECSWIPLQTCNVTPYPFGGTSMLGTAGEDIGIGKVIIMGSDGKFYLNNPADTTTYQRVIGFSTMAVLKNQPLRVLISGYLTTSAWTLSAGVIYFTSSGGNITGSIPATGISQVVAIAQTSTTILIEIRQPIIL